MCVEDNLLNGITLARVTSEVPKHPMGHANKRAPEHQWRFGLGSRMRDDCTRIARPQVSDVMGRDPFAWAANKRMKLTSGRRPPYARSQLMRSVGPT